MDSPDEEEEGIFQEFGCQSPKCIHYYAWTQIIIFTSVSVFVALNLLSYPFNTEDLYMLVALIGIVLLVVVGFALPATPVFVVAHAPQYFATSKSIEKYRGFRLSSAERTWMMSLMCTEVAVLLTFVLMAVVLLKGCSQKTASYLKVWTIFAEICFAFVTLETIIGVVGILVYKWNDDFYIILSECAILVIRFGLSVLFFVLPVRSARRLQRQILQSATNKSNMSIDDEFTTRLTEP